jgi:hypothetical protein
MAGVGCVATSQNCDGNLSVWLQLLTLGDSQHYNASSGCHIQQVCPRFPCNESRNSALPEAVNAKAEKVAKQVIACCDATKDIVRLRVKFRRIGRVMGIVDMA